MKAAPTLVWFRQDLRLRDNPALMAAAARGGAVIPVFILDERGEADWAPGAASRWWLHRSLAALAAELETRGSRLILARGDSARVLSDLVRGTGAGAVYWNRRYEPASRSRDAAVTAEFSAAGVEVRTFNSALLFEPGAVLNRAGQPFQVFTPFWRRCLELPVAPAKAGVPRLPPPTRWPESLGLVVLKLEPRSAGDAGLREGWQPGERGAAADLRRFLGRGLKDYAAGRDRLGGEGTSRLSPRLHWGELGPRQIWTAIAARASGTGVFPPGKGAGVYLKEIGWREFAYHLLVAFPHTPRLPLRDKFLRFPWAEDPGGKLLRAWQRGLTGYPVVDAGMRELGRTGWMHNRARMIAASFLVKHLRLPWQAGADWFWESLVDADLANNTLGWQWNAGCGADAAPYFRIFAPVTQGRKFDADGTYIRRWVPELAGLPNRHLHAPWEAPADVLAAAGVRLGETYPRPIVDHATARGEALAAFRALVPATAGSRAEDRFRELTLRLNRGIAPRASDVRPLA